MNNLVLFSSLSILVPSGLAVVRLKQIDPGYYPLLILLFVGTLTEALSYIVATAGSTTIVVINIYLLLEGIIIACFFNTMKLIGKRVLFVLATSLMLVWVIEAIVSSGKQYVNFYGVYQALLIVLLSITMINKLVAFERGKLLQNSVFLVCVSFSIYFTLHALTSAIWTWGVSRSNDFLENLHFIVLYVNICTNLVLAMAILLAPKKQASLLP